MPTYGGGGSGTYNPPAPHPNGFKVIAQQQKAFRRTLPAGRQIPRPAWTGRSVRTTPYHTPTRTVYSTPTHKVAPILKTKVAPGGGGGGRTVKVRGGGGGRVGGGGPFNSIVRQAIKLSKSPIAANRSLINPQAIVAPLLGSYIDPNQVAQDAGNADQAGIDALIGNLGTTKAQNAQDLKDTSDWFGQAQNTAAQGATDNATALAQALSGSNSAAQGLLSAIGGQANPAAAGLVNSADIANAALQGIGAAQTGYDNSEKGILSLDAAQQLQNEQTAGSNKLQDILNQISGAKTQQAADENTARDNAAQQLFSQKSSVANMLSNLQGNLFNEKMGVRQERLSELGGLSNTILGAALAGPQLAQAKLGTAQAKLALKGAQLQNKGLQAQIKAYTTKGNASGGAYWQNAPLSVTNGLRSQVLSPGGEYIKANGNLKIAPPAVKASLTREFATLGFRNSPALQKEIDLLTQTILSKRSVSQWDAKHGTHYARTGGY